MLIHPWDLASPDEWRPWIADGRNFGHLVANGTGWPVVVPTHFTGHGSDTLLVHLARPNPMRAAIEADPRVALTVLDDYAYIPSTWRPVPNQPVEAGVPTSYYAAVHFHCHATLVDDPQEKAELLTAQLAHLQPEGGHANVDTAEGPYHRLLSGIFGIRLKVLEVRAKFKYDDHKPVDFREHVSEHLAERGGPHDHGAHARQQERLARTAIREEP